MERTIGKIFEIEEKAKLIIDRANREKLRMHDEFDEELVRMERDINEENLRKINIYRSEIEQELEQEKAQMVNKSEKQLKDMDTLYHNNHDDLVNRIFEGILRS